MEEPVMVDAKQLTTRAVIPIWGNQNVQTVGPREPLLVEDDRFLRRCL